MLVFHKAVLKKRFNLVWLIFTKTWHLCKKSLHKYLTKIHIGFNKIYMSIAFYNRNVINGTCLYDISLAIFACQNFVKSIDKSIKSGAIIKQCRS